MNPSTMLHPARMLYNGLHKRYERWSELRTAEAMIVSFPKSGRTWLRYMLGLIVEGLGGDKVTFDNLLNPVVPGFPRMLFTHAGSDKYVKTAKLIAPTEHPDKVIVLLARDPRDVVVSYFFELTKRTPVFHGSLNDFLFNVDYGLPGIIEFMNSWIRADEMRMSFMLLRYEDLTNETLREMRRLLGFLTAIRIEDEVLEHAIRESSFRSMRRLEEAKRYGPRLRPGDPNDTESFKTRKGRIGGHVDYLSMEQVASIDEFIDARLDPRYGY